MRLERVSQLSDECMTVLLESGGILCKEQDFAPSIVLHEHQPAKSASHASCSESSTRGASSIVEIDSIRETLITTRAQSRKRQSHLFSNGQEFSRIGKVPRGNFTRNRSKSRLFGLNLIDYHSKFAQNTISPFKMTEKRVDFAKKGKNIA